MKWLKVVTAAGVSIVSVMVARAYCQPGRGSTLFGEFVDGERAAAGASATPSGGTSTSPSMVTSGSQRRNPGSHQFHSPSSRIVAGRSTLRTIVASRRTATASPNPSCLMMTSSRVTNTAKTVTMIAAALVIVPEVMAMPRATASFEDIP